MGNKGAFCENRTFSAWIRAKLTGRYSKRHLQHESMPLASCTLALSVFVSFDQRSLVSSSEHRTSMDSMQHPQHTVRNEDSRCEMGYEIVSLASFTTFLLRHAQKSKFDEKVTISYREGLGTSLTYGISNF